MNSREIVQVACSEFPPYVYQENGEIKGVGYQITKEMFQRANIPFTYRIIPWARVYDYGLKKEIFSWLLRTDQKKRGNISLD